jgi:hypothetical protein
MNVSVTRVPEPMALPLPFFDLLTQLADRVLDALESAFVQRRRTHVQFSWLQGLFPHRPTPAGVPLSGSALALALGATGEGTTTAYCLRIPIRLLSPSLPL